MYAANAKALPVLAQPYTTEAPEVEALLRMADAGLRVDEVPVDMRDRASGESKLRGMKSLLVVVTVDRHAARLLAAATLMRLRRGARLLGAAQVASCTPFARRACGTPRGSRRTRSC